MRRPLACVAVLAALSASVLAQELESTFQEAVDLLGRGRQEEALVKLKEVLAMDPSQADAHELFASTDWRTWQDLMMAGGEHQQVAERLLELARLGRKEHAADPEAIRALVAQVNSENVVERMQAVQRLTADHGEYAAPYLIHALADPDDEDRRVLHMQALTRIGGDVVLPLIAALDAPDAYLRRNVALTLGYIADPRAGAFLAASAAADEDEGVRNAAAEAASRSGVSGNAVVALLELGDGWQAMDPAVLMPQQVSDVIWRWEGNGLASTEVPAYLYNEELAKTAFYQALQLQPASTEALAGVARAVAAEQGELAVRQAQGDDVGEWAERLAADELAVQVAGTGALDLALQWALQHGDVLAASGLCRALGASASAPTPGLLSALSTRTSGAVRGEAAVALGRIAAHTGRAADAAVIEALGEAAAREVLRIVAVIDGDDARRQAVEQALAAQGYSVHAWSTGARGLYALRNVPGVDAVIVAETLPDLTFAQVANEVRSNPGMAETPVILLAADPAAAMELWGEMATAATTGAEDLAPVEAALEGGMNRDREEANRLAADAAGTLAQLAHAGHSNLGNVPYMLAETLAAKPDEVAVPMMNALAAAGGVGQVGALSAVLADGERSDAAREAAAQALAGIFARSPQGADEMTLQVLNETATSEAAFPVRRAAATALGRLDLDPTIRATLVEGVRAQIGG